MSARAGLVTVTDNGDGTATVRKHLPSGEVASTTVDMREGRETRDGPEPRPRGPAAGDLEAEILIADGPGKGIGKGLSDCTWCRFGKPALAGAVGGLAIASVIGQEPTRGLVWGGVSGLLYGYVRG